jgi:hypothetical protein
MVSNGLLRKKENPKIKKQKKLTIKKMKISNLTQNLLIFSTLLVVGGLIVSKHLLKIREDINKNF